MPYKVSIHFSLKPRNFIGILDHDDDRDDRLASHKNSGRTPHLIHPARTASLHSIYAQHYSATQCIATQLIFSTFHSIFSQYFPLHKTSKTAAIFSLELPPALQSANVMPQKTFSCTLLGSSRMCTRLCHQMHQILLMLHQLSGFRMNLHKSLTTFSLPPARSHRSIFEPPLHQTQTEEKSMASRKEKKMDP